MKRKFSICADCANILWNGGHVACMIGFKEEDSDVPAGYVRYRGQGIVPGGIPGGIGYFENRPVPAECANETYCVMRSLREL